MERINVLKFETGITLFEEKFDMSIPEEHRQILICLATMQNLGKLQTAFVGDKVILRDGSISPFDYDYGSRYELMRFDWYDTDKEDFSNPFYAIEEAIDYGEVKRFFPLARGLYGDTYDFLYLAQRKDGQVERTVRAMREFIEIGFLAINLKSLVKDAVLKKDVPEIEEVIGRKLEDFYYKNDLET